MEQPDRPSDEAILQFEQSIRNAEVENRPLVDVLEPRVNLKHEYERGSPQFLEKIDNLANYEYEHFRRCRGKTQSGDGNCFYRALGFAYFQSMIDNVQRLADARALAQSHKELLTAAGFEEFAYVDFFDEFVSVLSKLDSIDGLLSLAGMADRDQTEAALGRDMDAVEALRLVMNEPMVSNAVVVHLRFITSAYLKLNAAMYEPFLDDGMTIEQMCNQQVEAMDREADQIHIIGLTKALKQGITVAYLDASHSSHDPTFHRFLASDEEEDVGQELGICLLYRPGHYDILYKQ